jgi:DNA-binding MarR family transcriptional regulator
MAKEFTGVWIPKAIYQNDKLTPTDKLILSDIYNLCAEGGDYFKTNETIANEVNISIPSVSRTIKKLINLNYIKCEYNGRSRLIKLISTLIKLIKQPNQIDKAAISKRLDSIHSSIHNKKHISKERPFKSKEFDEIWDIWIDERKQQKRKKYTPRGEKATLHNLQKISKNSN